MQVLQTWGIWREGGVRAPLVTRPSPQTSHDVQRANVAVFSERADAPYPSLAEDNLMCLCVWIRPVSCAVYMVSPKSQAPRMEYKTTASISRGP